MLRWSAETTDREIDITAVAHPEVPAGIAGEDSLRRLARLGACLTAPDDRGVRLVAKELGDQAASDAAAVAAAFEGLNRIVDATGLPIGKAARRDLADIIEALGLGAFLHADHGT